MRRAVFLDRDGVLNRVVVRDGRLFVPASLEELELLPGVSAALLSLKAAGFLLVGITNQPDVARGGVSLDSVESIHEYMRRHLPLDDIRVCYHVDEDRCVCRKPMPGMIHAASAAHDIQLDSSFMVGDRWRDIGAGQRAGCRTILVNAIREETRVEPDVELPDLPAAAAWILRTTTAYLF